MRRDEENDLWIFLKGGRKKKDPFYSGLKTTTTRHCSAQPLQDAANRGLIVMPCKKSHVFHSVDKRDVPWFVSFSRSSEGLFFFRFATASVVVPSGAAVDHAAGINYSNFHVH